MGVFQPFATFMEKRCWISISGVGVKGGYASFGAPILNLVLVDTSNGRIAVPLHLYWSGKALDIEVELQKCVNRF